MGNRRLRNPVHGIEIGLECAIKIFRAHGRDVIAILLVASIDDEDVDPAEKASH